MPVVRMPDGANVSFPDDMPAEQIRGLIASKFPEVAQPPRPDFAQRVGQDLSTRAQDIADAKFANRRGEITMPQYALRTLGAAAGGLSDIIGEGMVSGYRALPEAAQKPMQKVGKFIAPAAQKFTQGQEALKQSYPSAYEDLRAITNIGLSIPIGKAVQSASTATGRGLEATGTIIEKSAAKSAVKNKQLFVQDLITPKQTPKVAEDLFGRSKPRWFGNNVVEPTPLERATIDTVSVLNVGKHKSLLSNYNVVKSANTKEAEALGSLLDKNDIAIKPENFTSKFGQAFKVLDESPSIVGDGRAAVGKLIDGAQKIIEKYPMTASGMLKARKEFDALAETQKGKSIFNPNLHSPLTDATRLIRQSMNDLIAAAVPNVAVKNSLQKQFHMYEAMDAIASKGAGEGKNVFTRAVQKAANQLPVTGPIKQGLLAAGLTGAAAAAPVVAGAGTALYLGQKAIRAPIVRQAAGKAIKTVGKVMQ